jgi:hypothetical protein
MRRNAGNHAPVDIGSVRDAVAARDDRFEATVA